MALTLILFLSLYISRAEHKKIEELNWKPYAIEIVDLLIVASNQHQKFFGENLVQKWEKKYIKWILWTDIWDLVCGKMANWNDCIYFGVILWNKCRCRRWHKNISCIYYYPYTCMINFIPLVLYMNQWLMQNLERYVLMFRVIFMCVCVRVFLSFLYKCYIGVNMLNLEYKRRVFSVSISLTLEIYTKKKKIFTHFNES